MKDGHSGRALLPSQPPGLRAEALSSVRLPKPRGNTGPLFQDQMHAEVTAAMPFFTLAMPGPRLNIDAGAEHSPAATESVMSGLRQKGARALH